MEQIRIGLIGAGDTGTALLQQLLDADFVQIVGIPDLSNIMPGMKLAHERCGPIGQGIGQKEIQAP